MIRRESRQLQPEVSLHRSADVGRAGGIDAPATVLILVIENVASGLVKTLLAARAEQRVEQNVIGFEGGIGFEFSAPVTLFVLLREKIVASRIDGDRDPALQVVDLPNRICGTEAELKGEDSSIYNSELRSKPLLRNRRSEL